MADIPHLRDLCFGRNRYRVPDGFAFGFVRLHKDDWQVAQRHWERIVQRVLRTDAVEPGATGQRALDQAVPAAAILLNRTDLRTQCPLCKPQFIPDGGERRVAG